MTNKEHYIAKILFKNKVLQYKGQAYEDFFVAIMTRQNVNFKPIKAYGRIGDHKNDGFDSMTGTYYQVFAPEDINKDYTIYEAVNKLENDFKGLLIHWNELCPIKNYYFVINDKYEGVPAPIEEKILSLRKENKDIVIDTLLAKDLEKKFETLEDTQVYEIVGYLPDEVATVIGFDALCETVNYLMSVEVPFVEASGLIVPDFDDKIVFNGLSTSVGKMLATAGYQDGSLKKYFNSNPGIDEILQEKFHALYIEAKTVIDDNKDNFADMRFFYILDKACVRKTIPIQNSVIALMSCYFASCDIFEEPIE
jgi:hypothetical protein